MQRLNISTFRKPITLRCSESLVIIKEIDMQSIFLILFIFDCDTLQEHTLYRAIVDHITNPTPAIY